MSDAPLYATPVPGEREGTTVLRLAGPLTLANLFGFQEDFRRMTSPRLILDMSGVEYMDSAGLGLVMNGYVSAQNSGRMYALAGVSPRVHALLEMTRVDTVLKVFPTVSEAEAAL